MADNPRYGNASGPKRATAKLEKVPTVSSCEGNMDSRVTNEDAHPAKPKP